MMRRFFTLPFLLTLVSVSWSVSGNARIIYTAPNGNDANLGTITSPYLTLNKVWTVVLPGDTVYMRGGTYAYNIQQYLSGKNGTAANMIKVWAYPGEKPVVTKGSPYTNNYYRGGCYFSGDYVHFRGIQITGFTQQDTYVWNGLLVLNSSNNIFEMLEVDNNGAGMYIQGASTGNLVLNCDFHENYDPFTGGGNADGLDVAYVNSGTTNTVRGCRAWSNSDDGFDSFENLGFILFDQCWSWNNGYIPGTGTPGSGSNGVGFKLGTVGTGNSNIFLRKLTNCVAFQNRLTGFHQEEGDCRMELYNNISYQNGEHGYLFDWLNRAHIFKNNIAFNNIENNAVISGASVVTNNSYGGAGYVSAGWANTTSAADFITIATTGVAGLRQLDGSLPNLSFFKLLVVSDLVDAGTVVGIPYNPAAPDIGAFEYGTAVPNQPPVANAGTDKNITLPTNTITQVGSGTDPDGTITAYQWTKLAGPTQFTIVSPTLATTVINNLVQGVYQFELRVTDNQGATDTDTMTVTVNAGPNQPPVANAGTDKNITLPTNSITQVGSGTDPDGTITAYQWTKVAGPTQFTIVSPTLATTVINNLVQGVYQFELRVTDNQGATDTDTMSVTVNAAPNQPPVANAGTDKNITLPTNSITQVGSGTDPDGTIASYQWSRVSGPAQYVIISPTLATTVINNLVQGVYQFELRVTDNQGATGRDTMVVTVNAAPPPNQAPTANAGPDQVISLPANTATVSGSGTDPDGTIAAYQWTKVAGPAQYTIVFPTQAQTVINNLVQGVYQFELRVTDNQGATDTDTMTITINAAPPNQPPVANAGTDKIITLPANSITQIGSGTDPDGTIASYQWTKLAGPTQFTIVFPTQAQTVINNLVQGIYQFELRVTDNQGATDTDTMTVTVNPASANQPPVANAGTDKNITLPVNSITQIGSGTDPDGTITAYQWTKLAGPTQFTIVFPTQAQTVINNLVQGVYQFELRVTDNQGATDTDTMTVTVNAAAPNQPPVANAGTDKNITLPTNSITQTGSGTDPDGTIASYQWTKVAGPAQFTIVSPTAAQTVINGLVQGVYQFELRVTDNQGATDTDTMSVTVNAAPANQPPVSNAGTDKVITLPTNSITQIGSGTDPDGTIVAYQWTKLTGPAQYTIVFPAQAQTMINNLVQGVYTFELTVTDNQGSTDTDTMTVTVNAGPTNLPPVADAGTDKSITLPVNSITQIGSGTDPDGTITAYQWTKISGPAQFNILFPTQAQTVIDGLVQGVYQFQLRVTDNQGATDTDTMIVTVSATPSNQSPVANAGTDKNITLPTNSVIQIGSGSDPDGTIAAYQWTKLTGPATFTIVFPTQAQTLFNNLVQGVYTFELTVTDNQGSTDTDTMTVTVNAAPSNQPPVANAGTDKNITLPTNSIIQIGSGTDPDGTIASYQWTKLTGPTTFTIVFPTQAQTMINNLVQGVYSFELRVTDNLGATDTDTMTVTVNAASSPNQAPSANAGPDQSFNMPTDFANVSGSGTDPDGTIASYLWTKISGPTQYTIIAPAQAQTGFLNLVEGVYQFELRVTDNQGAIGRDTLTINVGPDPNRISTAIIYPNPATTEINVRIDAVTTTNKTRIQIFNVMGMIVYDKESMRTQQVTTTLIDIAQYAKGTYFVKIAVDINNSRTISFVKQ